ncbi:MAG: hypothetical protein JNL57_08635 [Bacteroidetes bacterium]|nr:hypothetical protein [Bacteroidota bacterium]
MPVFLVESALPEFTPEFAARIPAHRAVVNRLFVKGKLLTYAVNADRTKWWCTVTAENEYEVMEILSEMPIIEFLNPEIHDLMIYNGQEQVLPPISLN